MSKILITNNSLEHFTGTESWVYAMAKELSKNNEVEVFTHHKGLMSNELEKSNINVVDNIGQYDLAIVNHTTTYNLVDCPKIFTSHSTVYDIERPPEKSVYVGINEVTARGGLIIRNGIDCERFKLSAINDKPINILYLSNPAYSKGLDFIREATKGYNLITIDEERFDIENLISQADIVISFARGALEAMACGKNVIYGDWRDGWTEGFLSGGMIMGNNFEKFKTGQMKDEARYFTVEDLRNEIKKYHSSCGLWLREQVLEHFNIKKTSQQYLKLWTSIKNAI